MKIHEQDEKKVVICLDELAVAWEGLAVRGVHHISVGSALELSLLDADGNVIANSEGALLLYDRLVLKTWPDDGGLLEIKLERL